MTERGGRFGEEEVTEGAGSLLEATEVDVVCEDVVELKGEWGAKEAVEDLEVRVEGPLGRVFRHFPDSPGRHREQGTPLLAQEHLRHLAVPLQRQQRVETVRVDEGIVQWWKRVLNGAHLACWTTINTPALGSGFSSPRHTLQ